MNEFLKGCIPCWKTGCIYNETIFCMNSENEISGKLQYAPQEILSVTDYTLKREYRENTDYFVSGRTISLSADSRIPWVDADIVRGNVPAPYRKRDEMADEKIDVVQFAPDVIWTESALLYGNQICVSYRVKPEDIRAELFGAYGKIAPRFTEKVREGQAVKISVLGDSVAEGCSASGHFKHEPYQPDWVKLFTLALGEIAGVDACTENFAVGGKDAQWGSGREQIENCARQKPDLLFLHFGINDCGRFDRDAFQKNIATIYTGVKAISPATEVVFIKPAMANPNCYSVQRFIEYWTAMDALALENRDFAAINMFDWSVALIKDKKYMDITGNGVNHPNDFVSRLYVMTLIHAFIPETCYLNL